MDIPVNILPMYHYRYVKSVV